MPIYEYRCSNGHTFEVIQSMSEDPTSECEVCGAEVERVFHPVAVHFKGSGFYTTDYKGKSKAGAGSGGEGGSGSDGAGGAGESKGDSKAEGKEKGDGESKGGESKGGGDSKGGDKAASGSSGD